MEGLEYQHDCHSEKKGSDGKVRERADVLSWWKDCYSV